MDLDTVIVGAGPYGLSIGAHLRAARVPFAMFGTPLESWRRFMPEGMVLKSEPFASSLWDPHRRYTFRRYCEANRLQYQAVGKPLTLARFLDYAEWFRKSTGIESRDVQVLRLRRVSSGFCLDLADSTTLHSRSVILATGHMAFRDIPAEIAHLPEPLAVHSTGIGSMSSYKDRDVTIIGAGQSALETAALMYEAGARVRLLVRRDRLQWNATSVPRSLLHRVFAPDAGVASGWKSWAISEFPRLFRSSFPPAKRHRFVNGSYGPSGAWWLRDRFEGRVEPWLNSRIEAATANGHVRLSIRRPDGMHEVTTDHVIAATGFKIDIDRLGCLDPALRQEIVRETGGIPALDAHFESSVRGLFIVGLASAPVFGPIMRFMYGAKHVGPILVPRLRSTA